MSNLYNFQAYINGKFVDADNQATITIKSPEDDSILGTIPSLSKKQIDQAYEDAYEAYLKWSKTSPQIRVQFIIEFLNELNNHTNYLAELLSKEVVKTFKDAKTEIVRTIEYIQETIHQYLELIENPEEYSWENQPSMPKNKIGIFSRVPLGVVLTISPFNYPVNLSLAKIIPALLMGNTVVHKSATQGSLVGAYIFQLFDNVRLSRITPIPPGVVNFITGKGSEIGSILINNNRIAAASFTGSTITGLQLAQKMVMKPYVLELGGKDSAIVCDDADLDLTAKEIIKGAYSYSGQRCTAIKRVFVTEKIASSLVEKLIKLTKELKVGTIKEDAIITSVVDDQSIKLVKKLYDDAIKKNAISLLGDLKIEKHLVYPVLLDHVTKDMDVAWVEPFAPILPIIRVQSIQEAIDLTNKSEYGLQTSVFTNNETILTNISNELNVGTVNQNKASSRGPDILPFSGVKNSGFGVQGIVAALLSFSRAKGLILNKEETD